MTWTRYLIIPTYAIFETARRWFCYRPIPRTLKGFWNRYKSNWGAWWISAWLWLDVIERIRKVL